MDWQIRNAQRIRIGLVLMTGLLFLSYVFAAPREQIIQAKLGTWAGGVSGKWDSSRGHYKFIEYGFAVPNHTAAIKKRHNVDVSFVDHGCVVTTYQMSYAHAYNSVMNHALRTRFGVDVIEEAEQDELKPFHP